MLNNTTDTEQQILTAAERLFVTQGFKATSTTDIAREAGCNQTLVHYYYRTKENLFQKVFDAKFEQLFSLIRKPLFEECDFFRKLENIVDVYFGIVQKNKSVPMFILNELLSNKERMEKAKDSFRSNHFREEVYAKYSESVYEARKKKMIRDVEPIDLLFDIVSLVVMSVMVAPVYSDYFSKGKSGEKEFIERRKTEVKRLLLNGLKFEK